mgnify:CR=1 FL=1
MVHLKPCLQKFNLSPLSTRNWSFWQALLNQPGVEAPLKVAAEGAGLGIQFLKHLSRTSLLLHVIDIYPHEGEDDPVSSARKVMEEIGIADNRRVQGLGQQQKSALLEQFGK